MTKNAIKDALKNRLGAEIAGDFRVLKEHELAKFNEQIFYTKELDFFLPKRKLAIICSPFSDADLVFLKFKKLHANLKNLGINRLQAISVANSGETSIEGIKCEVAPFSRWALGI